ncbi:Guanine deaminase [Planctomycetes bacterium MalM25]|nr:Guanine deaminase [Planctomycetes bacterium MalM25]
MIVAGHLLLEEEGDARCRLAPGYLRAEEGTIVEVVEGEIPRNADAGGVDWLVSPGLIDTHVHLPQFDMIGAHGLPLLKWLDGVTFPAEMKWADADYAAGMTRRVAQQLAAHGTTSVCAYSSVHHEATAAAIATLRAFGLRGVVGQALSDRQAPAELCRESAALLDQTNDLLERFPASEPIAAAITPRFAVSCTPELLEGAGRLASEHAGALVQTHLSETRAECELIGELFEGRSYVGVYDDAGLLTDRSLLGHGIHLSDEERTTLRERRAVVAHCPTANSFLRSGAMDRQAGLDADVRLSLGSDIGAGYERSMVRVGRAMIETAASLGEAYPSAAEAWWQITAGNADAAHFADAGRLRVGTPADLLLARPEIPWLEPPVDPLARALFSWDDRWVRRVLASGRIIFSNP